MDSSASGFDVPMPTFPFVINTLLEKEIGALKVLVELSCTELEST